MLGKKKGKGMGRRKVKGKANRKGKEIEKVDTPVLSLEIVSA